MSKGDNTPGISKFTAVIDSLIAKRKDTSLVLDYGEINGDYSLTTNTYPVPIPKKDYMVCRHLKPVRRSTASSEGHSHTYRPNEKLQVGDRVLVAWILNDPVIIDVIIHGNDAFEE